MSRRSDERKWVEISMNELYAEVNVKAKPTTNSLLIRMGMIGGSALLLIAALFLGITILVPFAALAILGTIYFMPRFSKIEYEYIYCDGQLDFDRIAGGASRKNVLRIDLEEVEMIAPKDSHYLDSFQNITNKKDFTSKNQKNIYVIVGGFGDKRMQIYFEPNEKMLNCLFTKAPSKVKKNA